MSKRIRTYALMDINTVEEIQVRYENGEEVIYRGKGLEKLRRMLLESPAYGEIAENVGPTIVDTCASEEEEEVKPVKTKKSIKKPATANGYITADLNYAPNAASKSKSAVDLAREMQRQAEQASGIKF